MIRQGNYTRKCSKVSWGHPKATLDPMMHAEGIPLHGSFPTPECAQSTVAPIATFSRLKEEQWLPEIAGDFYKCPKSRSHPNSQRISSKCLRTEFWREGAEGKLGITFNYIPHLLCFLFPSGDTSSTPPPFPKKISKTLFHLYLWHFKQLRVKGKTEWMNEWMTASILPHQEQDFTCQFLRLVNQVHF